MNNLLSSLDTVMLMGPGPSCIAPEVYKALSSTTVGHLDHQFIQIMDAIKKQLCQVFGTQNAMTVPMSGTGSAGMETCFVNLIEPGDKVLVLKNGVFGTRMEDVASRLGAKVDALGFEWGTPVDIPAVKSQLEKQTYAIVAVVHAETSTGVANPVAEIGEMVNAAGALYLVDTVTSLGGIPVEIDKWHADAVYSGTQKCLSCPPGLAPVSFSARAVEKLQGRKAKVPNWYLDLSMIASYWAGAKRVYHHTAPINMLYGLYQALSLVLDEGLESVYDRHRTMHEHLVAGLAEMGLELLVKPQYRLPMLNAVVVPEKTDEAAIRTRLRSEFTIEIGAGLGPLAGKIWRIGLMGHTARIENVDYLLSSLKKCL